LLLVDARAKYQIALSFTRVRRLGLWGALKSLRPANQQVSRIGIEFTHPTGYSGVFVDPDGHPWEVARNPNWTIGEGGSVTLAP
jgi:hypothetical protein